MSLLDSGVGVLARDLQVRVLSVSESGCLIESPRRIEVGLVGRLWLRFGFDEYDDHVHVVRCQAIEGGGTVYHVGLRFVWSPRLAGSIRHAVTHRLVSEITGVTARVM